MIKLGTFKSGPIKTTKDLDEELKKLDLFFDKLIEDEKHKENDK